MASQPAPRRRATDSASPSVHSGLTSACAKALDKLGVSAYDAGGALKPIGEVADDLKAKLDNLSEQDRNAALKNIFGSDAPLTDHHQ